MENIKLYLKSSYEELMTNVSWPSWKDLQANAVVVIIGSIIIALIIFLMDFLSNLVFSKLIY